MHFSIGIVMVGFLKYLIGADAGFAQLNEAFYRERSGVDIDPADFSDSSAHGIFN